jgi:hypothetical protein
MRRRTSYLIIALLIVIVGGGAFVLIEISFPHASDSELIKKFNERKPDFNLLAQMADEDSKVSYISATSIRFGTSISWHEYETWPRFEADFGFSQQRWNVYRGLFKKLDLHGIDRKDEMPDAVFFTASIYFSTLDDGPEVAVTEKGYVYSAKEIHDSRPGSLDGVRINRPAMFFKRLNDHDHWYLFYEWSVSKPE